MHDGDAADDVVVTEVGNRLRALRRRRGLTLGDVEDRSGRRWRASTVGAYERGIRAPSLAVLGGLASFYGVPLATLVGGPDADSSMRADKVVIDLRASAAADLERPMLRLLHRIALQRGDPGGLVLSVRSSDLELLAVMLGVDVTTFVEQLHERGVLSGGPAPTEERLLAVQS